MKKEGGRRGEVKGIKRKEWGREWRVVGRVVGRGEWWGEKRGGTKVAGRGREGPSGREGRRADLLER